MSTDLRGRERPNAATSQWLRQEPHAAPQSDVTATQPTKNGEKRFPPFR